MKQLLLMRHGKSDRTAQVPDHDRPLNPRGVTASSTMGRVLRDLGQVPDLVISSTARRARDTADLAVEAGGWPAPITLERDLYLASPREVLRVAAGVTDGVDRLLLVGHDPTWTTLVGLFTGARVHMKTAQVAGIELGIDAWDDIGDGEGELAFLLPPRLFTDSDYTPSTG